VTLTLAHHLLKKINERAKSTTKMATREMTTEAVVDSPTPLAPPVVVCPHPQLMVAITPPNDSPLAHITMISDVSKYFAAESRMMLGEMPLRSDATRDQRPMATSMWM